MNLHAPAKSLGLPPLDRRAPEDHTSFDAALQSALARRGLPLARVQAHLTAAGHRIAVSTLSQWQHGRRVPRSPRSLAVVEELERILQVPPGALRRLVEAENAGRPDLRPVVEYAGAYGALIGQLGSYSYGTLETVSAHDRLWIGADGSMMRRRTTMVMRATGRADRHVMAHGVDDGGDVDLVNLRARGGCRIGRTAVDEDAGVMAAELHFDRTLSPGETVVYEFEVQDGNTVPCDHYFRWSTTPIPLLVMEVSFDRDLLPSSVTAYERARSDSADRTATELALARDDRVHLAVEQAGAGVHGIRWTWPGRR